MYKKRPETHTITGVITTTLRGIGFVEHPDFKEDIRIEAGFLHTALNGDTVEVTLHPLRKRQEPSGEVLRVVSRAKIRFVGVVEREKNVTYVIPDDRRAYTSFLLPETDAPNGTKVFVELLEWTDPGKFPRVRLIKILGPKGNHEIEMESIVLAKGIDMHFPEDVAEEAQQIQKEWYASREAYCASAVERGERKDFRDALTFTIDPADAKDFDDALSWRDIGGGRLEVGVHIADVSYYVKPGSALDEEATKRGFSVYLVDRTIPMLPVELSNDICSLNPDDDRLAFSAVFTLDQNGAVRSEWFGRTIIHSDKRFSYEEAQDVLDSRGEVALREKFGSVLQTLNSFAEKLRKDRFREGAIDFGDEEFSFELDEKGAPVAIRRKVRLATHKLIEEFMLLANRRVAEHVHGKSTKSDRTFIYRVHDRPDRDKLMNLGELLKILGYPLHTEGRVTARHINDVLERVTGTPVEHLVKTAAVRSMQKAAYTTENIGHFGLGFEYYTHFTSPIRRYPDLIAHRLLDAHEKNEVVGTDTALRYKELSLELSAKEVTVQEAERESVRYKQAEFMQEHIGKTVEGVIAGVTDWGVFVEDEATGAEGLVRIATLADDYYILEEKRHRLVGKRTKKTYTLGDRVRVQVVSANVDRRTIDYKLV